MTEFSHITFPFTYPKTEKDCMYQTNLAEVNPNNSAVFLLFYSEISKYETRLTRS